MSLDEIVQTLRTHRDDLRSMHVRSLAVFGSVARGEDLPGSDVDLLVEFDRPVGLLHFVEVKQRIQDLLGTEVDLVTRAALKRQLKDQVLAEAVDVA